jgi:hypothetical protein
MKKMKERLIEIVGKVGVVERPELDESFSLDHKLILPRRATLLVKPSNVNEVQSIVLEANKMQAPIVPVSSGPPHFHGGSTPTSSEAIVMDLSGMNRVLKINRRNRLVLIEPGVTFSQLLPALKREGVRIIMPLLPRGNKSVIASLLEREPVMSPKYQWNLLEPLRSLEIIWGNGEKFYSGSGTFRGESDEDWEQGLVPVQGPGPGQLDFYKFVSAAQGSMGIVTWASVKCEVYPETHKLYLIPAGKLEDLIDFMYKLLRFRLGDELFILNSTCLATIMGDNQDVIETLKYSLPHWTVIVGISGGEILPREKVVAQESDIADIAQEFGLEMVPAVSGCNGVQLLELILNPSPEPYWKLRSKGASQEIFFLTTLDKTPGFVSSMQEVANQHRYPTSEIGVYLQPVHQGVGCHCEFMLPFDPQDQVEVHKTEALFRDASQSLFQQKAYFSRPYGIWADMVYNADARTMIVTQKMKEIFDPNNVMNPGKLCF